MKTGYHAVYENGFYNGIDNASTNGFDFVQFDLGVPEFFLDGLSTRDLISMRDYAKDKGVEITFHAPGDNVSLFCDYPFIRDGIQKQFKSIIEKANILEARHLTIHAGAYPSFRKSGTKIDDFSVSHKEYYEAILYENLKELILSSTKTLICLENYNFNPIIINAAKRLIDNGFALYLTLDTAKVYTKDGKLNSKEFDFFTEYKNSIREIHLHDLNEQFGSHQIVGTGIVDFTLFHHLIQSDDVYVNFEVRPVESAVKSRKALAQILSRTDLGTSL